MFELLTLPPIVVIGGGILVGIKYAMPTIERLAEAHARWEKEARGGD